MDRVDGNFDPAEYLDDEKALAEYLTEALATEDVAFIADAIGVVARAKGMTRIAEDWTCPALVPLRVLI